MPTLLVPNPPFLNNKRRRSTRSFLGRFMQHKTQIEEDEVDCAQPSMASHDFSHQLKEEALNSEHDYVASEPPVGRRSSIATSIDRSLSTVNEDISENPAYDRAIQALELQSDERVTSSYGAWFITSVMSQGRMFLTNKAVHFHANLPYFSAQTLKASTLKMRHKGTLHSTYSKYWFMLRQDSFCYSANSTETVSVIGAIDLTTALYAHVTEKDPRVFVLVTENKSHVFKADSPNSAHDWVKQLSREIFRSRNNGPYVRVRIPFENIMQVDRSVVVSDTGFDVLILKALAGPDSGIKSFHFGIFYEAERAISTFKQWIKTEQHAQESETDSGISLSRSPGSPISEVYDSTFHPPMTPISSDEWSNMLSDRGFQSESIYTDESPSRTPDVFSPAHTPNLRSPALSRSNSSTNTPVLSAINKGLNKVIDEVPQPPNPLKLGSYLADDVSHLKPASLNNLELPEAKRVDSSQMSAAEEVQVSNETFRHTFSFGPFVQLIESYVCYLYRNHVPYFGRLYISDEFLCFQKLDSGGKPPSESNEMLIIVPWNEVEDVVKLPQEKVARHGFHGIAVVLGTTESLNLEFRSKHTPQAIISVIKEADDIRRVKQYELMGTYPSNEQDSQYAIRFARLATYEQAVSKRINLNIPPVVLDPLITNVREPFLSGPLKKLHVVMLTIGSRGDVQPYIALSQGLMAEGHKCTIATHAEFKDWVESFGITFKEVAGDPKALMEIMIEHGGFSYTFLREASQKFSGWLDDLLKTSWEACQGADLLIESPSAMAGLHIAEALEIPYYRAFTMPWTRTRVYPHAFIVPDQQHSGSYNYVTYVLFEKMLWLGIGSHVNSWRKHTLKLPKTSLEQMRQQDIPFLYCVSPSVLPPTMDQPDWIHVTGYWTLKSDQKKNAPDPKLVDFLARAKEDQVPVVYIGFGSIVVKDPAAMSQAIIKGVQLAKVRAVLAKGWSARGTNETDDTKFPPEIYQVDSVPHDWLFPQVAAAVHHGGSGTTGMSLSCGLPTIIKPFFGDQNFYSQRVEAMGVGLRLQKLTATTLSKALIEATTNKELIIKAKAVGESISHERGVDAAIAAIYSELPYANSRVGKSFEPGFFSKELEKTNKELDKSAHELEKIIEKRSQNVAHKKSHHGKSWVPSLNIWSSIKSATGSSSHLNTPAGSPTLVPTESNESVDPLSHH